MIPHHTGCAVRDLVRAQETYRELLPAARRSRVFDVPTQRVSVCFVELAPGFYLELVAGAPVERFAAAGFYHLCFLVENLATAIGGLDRTRFRPLPAFESAAFAGHRCQFVLTPEMHFIELAELSPARFEQHFAENLVT